MPTVLNASTVAQTIPALGVTVPAGETFECSEELAAELIERPDFAKPNPPRKPAGKSKES